MLVELRASSTTQSHVLTSLPPSLPLARHPPPISLHAGQSFFSKLLLSILPHQKKRTFLQVADYRESGPAGRMSPTGHWLIVTQLAETPVLGRVHWVFLKRVHGGGVVILWLVTRSPPLAGGIWGSEWDVVVNRLVPG